jgi:hypothetical protein
MGLIYASLDCLGPIRSPSGSMRPIRSPSGPMRSLDCHGASAGALGELLAVASGVLDAQGIILVGTSFGASVPSEQVDPSSTDAGLEGRAFVHGSGADSALFGIKGPAVRSHVRTIVPGRPLVYGPPTQSLTTARLLPPPLRSLGHMAVRR